MAINASRKRSFSFAELKCWAECTINLVNDVGGEAVNVFLDLVGAFLLRNYRDLC